MITLNIFGIVLLTASLSISSGQTISSRMIGGAQIDTMKRFPSSVNIQPIDEFGEKAKSCSGSILTDQWILTTEDCVNRAKLIQIDFDKLYVNSTFGSYSVIVNNDDKSVIVYPTYYDGLALIKIALRIMFTKTVQPITLSEQPASQLFNQLAVTPGFDEKSGKQQLTYSMMTVIPHDACLRCYYSYDEFKQMCVKPYRNYKNGPSSSDSGAALIAGWPVKPELVGMYMEKPNDCNSGSPWVFVSISKYLPWIRSIIGEAYDFTPTSTPSTTTGVYTYIPYTTTAVYT